MSSAPRKAPPIENKLPCSLEELYSGTTKKMKIFKEIADASGTRIVCLIKSPTVWFYVMLMSTRMITSLAGSVTAVFNCQGPLDAPIFVGSGLVSRKIAHSVSDFPASAAYEAMMRNQEAGAVAAIDRVPFSYISANFTFNTDNCVADLYGIRASLVDGGEIRGAGNAWICPEVLNCMQTLNCFKVRWRNVWGEIFNSFGEGRPMSSAPRKAPPIENKLPCSLEELYSGTTKKMKIFREIADASG
ncbi:hypothetical protein F0562_015915 [Nyssa sinensis]|uniref:Uncharacterized protein n=1 Tax=Nyssa sinensis TaxID=561372 RepID=A0A5J4ZMZ3_9ASTE|nr:hypothetical protein F0562_015915 [Nyssa sinensis]